jgi:flagellar basal body-associated protein FliL
VKIGKKTIVLLGLPLGIGIAAAVVVLVVLKPFGASAPPGVPDPTGEQHGVMLPLDTKVVNLTAGGDFKYAKVGVTLELRPETADFYALKAEARTAAEALIVKDFADILPVLDDAVATVVSSKNSTELNSAEGRSQLRQELLEALRAVLDGEGGAAAQPGASPAAEGASPAAEGASPAAAPAPSRVIDLYFTDLVMQ